MSNDQRAGEAANESPKRNAAVSPGAAVVMYDEVTTFTEADFDRVKHHLTSPSRGRSEDPSPPVGPERDEGGAEAPPS